MLTLRTDLNRKITASELDANFTYLLQEIQSITASTTASVTTTFTDVTYSELVQKIGSSELVPGTFYQITDYRTAYDQPDFDFDGAATYSESTYKTCPIEPIVVLSLSESTISSQAYQPLYPNDSIKYDWTFNETEVTGGTAFGRITERQDDRGNRTDYDHRNVLFKRYKTYRYDPFEPLNGEINIEGITVSGVGTSFSVDLVTSSVFFSDGYFWKVASILSDDLLTITASNLISNGDLSYYLAEEIEYIEPGKLYLFSDEGFSNEISDGGDDMYDDANMIYTDLNQVNYTHTQLSENGPLPIESFISDGRVQPNDASYSTFGTGSFFFTNLYPGLFVLSAATMSINEFRIDGNIGSDGDGLVDTLSFTTSYNSNLYSVFVKRVYDTNDPSINQIIIIPGDNVGLSQSVDFTSEDDFHQITGLSGKDRLSYLLMALSGGVKITDSEIQQVVQAYLSLWNGNNIDTLLSNLNSNYTDITGIFDYSIGLYGTYYDNNIPDDGFDEIKTFSDKALNTWVGDNAKYYPQRTDFILSNNVMISDDFYDNKIGDLFINNTIINRDFFNNTIGSRIEGNEIFGDFEENFIWGYDFSFNKTYDLFDENYISTNFEDNIIIGSFQDSRIEKDFLENIISVGNFSGNEIGNDFSFNRIRTEDFLRNRIGSSFEENLIQINNFSDNDISSSFQFNTMTFSVDFESNRISVNFRDNNIEDDFQMNSIMGDFDSNNIEIALRNNSISSAIDSLTITQSAPSELTDTTSVQVIRDSNSDILATWFANGSMTFSQLG